MFMKIAQTQKTQVSYAGSSQEGTWKEKENHWRFGQRKGGRPSEWVILGMETFKRPYTHSHKYHPDETPTQHNKYELVKIYFREERPRLEMSSFGRKLACHKLSRCCVAVTLTLGTWRQQGQKNRRGEEKKKKEKSTWLARFIESHINIIHRKYWSSPEYLKWLLTPIY